jgi:hypothetical protein
MKCHKKQMTRKLKEKICWQRKWDEMIPAPVGAVKNIKNVVWI